MRAMQRERIRGLAVAVIVGAEEGEVDNGETFTIHTTVLKATSKFFQAALSKEWKEAKTRTIYLPDDEPDIASIYFDWLYTKEVTSRTDDTISKVEHGYESHRLAKCYVFGEKIQDDDFCNDTISALTELFDATCEDTRCFATSGCIEAIYGGTPEGSPAPVLMVDIIVQFGGPGWMTLYRPAVLKYPEFALDLSTALFSKAKPLQGTLLFVNHSKWFKKAEEKKEAE